MANRAERVVDMVDAVLDEMVRKNPVIDAAGILVALSQAGLALVNKSDPHWRLAVEAFDRRTAGDLAKCPMCGGLGVSATSEQFENAYKRH